jgi:dTMP kinase
LRLSEVKGIVDFAVGETRPHLTLFLFIPPEVSEQRRLARQGTLPFMRDRIEESDRHFFARVAEGYEAVMKAEPERVRRIEANGAVEAVRAAIWKEVAPLVATSPEHSWRREGGPYLSR